VTSSPHDALFKAGFESPLNAAALFRQVLPPELVEAIDWQTIQREAGSFVDPELASRHTDLLFSVQLVSVQFGDEREHGKQGTRLLLYLLVEHQSTNDPKMPLRMLVYLVRIWEAYEKLHGAPLPLIIPVVVSHAPEGWTAPTSFHALFEPPPDSIPHVARLVPGFSFLLTDLVRTSNEELRRWQLPPFAMTALRYLRDGRHFDQLLQNMPEWIGPLDRLARGPERNLAALEQLLRYIALVTGELRFAVFRAMLASQIPETEEVTMTVAEELRAEGEAKGLAKGRRQGRAEVLDKQMMLKFGALSTEHAAIIDTATEQQLDVYVERILTATSAAEVFAER
jgi:predicted transposase YdaD